MSINPSQESDRINQEVERLLDTVKNEKNFTGDSKKLNETKEALKKLYFDVTRRITHYGEKIEAIKKSSKPEKTRKAELESSKTKLKTQDANLKTLKKINDIINKLEIQSHIGKSPARTTGNPSKPSNAINKTVAQILEKGNKKETITLDDLKTLKKETDKTLSMARGRVDYYSKKEHDKSTESTKAKLGTQQDNVIELIKMRENLELRIEKGNKKETFLNTSGSARFSNYNGKNVGAHILGFFEAIGRAVLTPFVAIYLAFASNNHDFTSTMKSYFETIKKSITLLE